MLPACTVTISIGCVKGGVHLHVAVAVKVHDHDHDHDHAINHEQTHLDECEVVATGLLEPCCDGPESLEAVETNLDEIALTVRRSTITYRSK